MVAAPALGSTPAGRASDSLNVGSDSALHCARVMIGAEIGPLLHLRARRHPGPVAYASSSTCSMTLGAVRSEHREPEHRLSRHRARGPPPATAWMPAPRLAPLTNNAHF